MANKEKGNSAKSPTKSQTFTLELYPEWTIISTIIAYIENNYDYAMIEHNKDVNENGEPKKTHIHVVVKCNRRRLSSVKNEFAEKGVPKNLINTCNKRAMLRYLTHIDDKDKAQYDRTEIKTNMPDEVEQAYLDEITNDKAFQILDKWIYEQPRYITQHELNQFVYENGYLGGFRKYSSAIGRAVNEHNQSYEKEERIKDLATQTTARMIQEATKDMGKQVDIAKSLGEIKTTMPDGNGNEIQVLLKVIDEKAVDDNDDDENNRKISQEELWRGLPKK